MNKFLEGIKITPLKKFENNQGMVLHMLKESSPEFIKFGEIYFSITYPGIIKGWTRHKKMTQNYAVPVGKLKLVLYDSRKQSSTFSKLQEIEVGLDDYKLITIPPEIWYSFKSIFKENTLIVNCTDLPHDPEEIEKCSINSSDIPYKWD